MSLQSDTEFLSVLAVEEYAKQNRIDVETAYELFRRHQMFEKILLRHEYLHQISTEEVMEFVYREMQGERKDRIVFHGTDADFTEIHLSKSHNKRDFGIGFYTTILEEQAKAWANRASACETGPSNTT